MVTKYWVYFGSKRRNRHAAIIPVRLGKTTMERNRFNSVISYMHMENLLEGLDTNDSNEVVFARSLDEADVILHPPGNIPKRLPRPDVRLVSIETLHETKCFNLMTEQMGRCVLAIRASIPRSRTASATRPRSKSKARTRAHTQKHKTAKRKSVGGSNNPFDYDILRGQLDRKSAPYRIHDRPTRSIAQILHESSGRAKRKSAGAASSSASSSQSRVAMMEARSGPDGVMNMDADGRATDIPMDIDNPLNSVLLGQTGLIMDLPEDDERADDD